MWGSWGWLWGGYGGLWGGVAVFEELWGYSLYFFKAAAQRWGGAQLWGGCDAAPHLPPPPPQSQDPPPTMALGVAVLHQLLQFSAQLPGLARDIGTDHIPGLLTSLLGLKAEVWGAP